ncbi:relaxase/mobilization nuclease domain-containing protein [Ferrovum myxofaciens]|nr:relaxase/mobilization nuclease domain-containing protein [Ferrovum myxofaciens]QWY75527.1 MAG: relaxase/mobilization nuclease domain-containing protein [Ferrovum myxofaciens]
MQKISRGAGFRGVLNYCERGGVRLPTGNMSGQTTRDLATEFKLSRNLRECKKPVWHSSLRLPKGETVSNERWCEIASEYMNEIGFDEDHQFSVFLHNESAGQHIHIVASRVSLSGRLFYGQNENLISTKIIQKLEKRFGLNQTKSDTTPKNRRAPKKAEIEKSLRTLIKPDRLALAEIIDSVLQNDRPKNHAELKKLLEVRGVEVTYFEKDGKISGVTFQQNTLKFSGAAIGENYKFQNLLLRMSEQHEQTISDTKPTEPARNVRNHTNFKTSEPENQGPAKKGLDPRSGRRANPEENRNFQTFLKENNMDTQEKPAGRLFYNQRTPRPHDPSNLDHGWVEYKDKAGRIWFYPADEQPQVGNRAGYAWENGTDTRAPGVLVFQDAIEKGVDQAARDAVRIAVFKGLPQPLKISGSEDFQRAVMREMFTFNIKLENKDGPARDEYNKLCKQKHEERLGLINRIDGNFREIDHKVIENKKAAIANIDTNKLSQKDKPAHGNRMKQ